MALEWQFNLVAPLLLHMAFDSARKSPRRHGVAFLAACSLVQPAVSGAIMAVAGFSQSTFLVVGGGYPITYSLPPTRCAPYLSGMAAALLCWQAACRAQQLPATTAEAAAAAGSAAGGGSGKDADSCGSLKDLEGQTAGSSDGSKAVSAARRRRALLCALDLSAVTVLLALSWLGPGTNRRVVKIHVKGWHRRQAG